MLLLTFSEIITGSLCFCECVLRRKNFSAHWKWIFYRTYRHTAHCCSLVVFCCCFVVCTFVIRSSWRRRSKHIESLIILKHSYIYTNSTNGLWDECEIGTRAIYSLVKLIRRMNTKKARIKRKFKINLAWKLLELQIC